MRMFTNRPIVEALKNHTLRLGMRYSLILILLIMASCNGQKSASHQNAGDGPLTLILQDNYSGTETEEMLIIKDQKSLRKFFAKVNRTRKPGLPVPEIDFSKDMVIVYCGGAGNKEGVPSISLIEETTTHLAFKANRGIAQDKSNSTTIISPFYVYKMPFTDKQIDFISQK